MTKTETLHVTNRLWPWETSIRLLLVGLILSVASFAFASNLPELDWHPDRDAELRVTYEAYRDTGVLLIKPTGTGSTYTQAPTSSPMTWATWDDDPGSYIIASLFSHITNADSPYPGLGQAQSLLVALPLLWLPIAIARLFRSARAGYSLLSLPLVMWLVNNGTMLVGTEYGLSDEVSTLRVYALYGIAASMAFLSLSFLLLLGTFRLRPSVLISVTLLVGVLAGFGNLSRALSGVGIAAAVGVLWWLNSTGRGRFVRAALVSVLTIGLAFGVQSGVMNLVNTERAAATHQAEDELPSSHGPWHSLYLGLSYPEPITGDPSRFDVSWSDAFGWNKALEVDSDVIIGSKGYDLILKDLYLDQLTEHPIAAVKTYMEKTAYLVHEFGFMLFFIAVGFVVALRRRGRHRKLLGAIIVLGAPTAAFGVLPPILVMPMLYYYSELSAVLGLLVAVSLGAMIWTLPTLPALGHEFRALYGKVLPVGRSKNKTRRTEL